MTYIEAVKTCLSKSIEIQGRASRSEYWWFFLFFIIVAVILSFTAQINQLFQVLSLIVYLVLYIPSFTVSVRRLHDLDKSGWFLLIGLIPIIGAILLIYWFVSPGTDGRNRFG